MDDGGVWTKIYPASSSNVVYPGRNLLYNGAMQVAQRGINATGISAGEGYYTADRWGFGSAFGQDSTLEVVDDGPEGFTKSLKWTTTTASGAGANIYQRLEGYDVQGIKKRNSKITLSFWLKGTMDALSADVLFVNGATANEDGVKNFTPSGQWTHHSVTYTINGSTPSANIDYAVSVHFSNATASAGTYVQITGVQLEVGETATEFEHKKYGTELAECKRYFERYSRWNAMDFPQGIAHVDEAFRPEVVVFYDQKRANPTITGSDPSHFTVLNCGTGASELAVDGPLSLVGTHERSTNLFWFVSGADFPRWSICSVVIEDGLGYLDIDAEL